MTDRNDEQMQLLVVGGKGCGFPLKLTDLSRPAPTLNLAFYVGQNNSVTEAWGYLAYAATLEEGH